MPRVKEKNIMSQEALEVLIEEVVTEGAEEYEEILDKLSKSRPGTERYRSLLCDLSVKAWTLEGKAKTAREAIDEYLDSLPDDE